MVRNVLLERVRNVLSRPYSAKRPMRTGAKRLARGAKRPIRMGAKRLTQGSEMS